MGNREVYRQVAQLHITCINQGFLPRLGRNFLALMYEAIDEADGAILVTAMDGDRVIGFVAGARAMKPIYLRMLRKFLRLAWALTPSLIKPSRLRRILEILNYGHDERDNKDLPQAELLSIAVDSEFRGKRRADDLYRDLCDDFVRQGQDKFKIIVGQSLEPAHRFYRRMGAVPIGNLRVHAGDETSLVYVQYLARSES